MPPPFDLIPYMLPGLKVTLQVTILGAALALVIALVAGVWCLKKCTHPRNRWVLR